MATKAPSPAEQLTGLVLDNGWKVVAMAARNPNATGGFFSQGYVVEDPTGRRGFLKALDYTAAFKSPNTAEMLLAMTNAYVFEKTLCEKCNHLSRVAKAIDNGAIQLDAKDYTTKVEYLIFELATCDVRAHLDRSSKLDTIFVLRTLHHVATGLKQLHRANIAHQDLKPSNVLVYSKEGSKICDLGRAWDRNLPAQHDALPIAGDQTYAPIECLYDSPASTIEARRYGCDFYHLGNLIVFFFTRARANSLLLYHVDPIYSPDNWGGAFEEVLPYLQAGFGASLVTLATYIPNYVQDDLIQIVTELCEPDPKRRGHPRNRLRRQFSLDYYVSRFDRLVQKAQVALVA